MQPDELDLDPADLAALGDRMDGTYTVPILAEPVGGPVPAPEPAVDEIRSMAGDDAVRAAAGHDVTPGHDELHHWWTKGPGLARWIESPHQWTTLRDLLAEHVPLEQANRMAAAWVHEVTGAWPGSDAHRVAEGHKPRGHNIGPG